MAEEKRFEERIKKFLKDEGCWFVKYWGGSQFTKSGIPDLLVCCEGYFIGVEVKATQGKPSELQLYNLKKIEEAGGCSVLLYPDQWELFKNFIYCIKYGDVNNAGSNYKLLKGRWEDADKSFKD